MTHLHSARVADAVTFPGGSKNKRPRLSAWIYRLFQHLADFAPHIQYLVNSYRVVTFALRKAALYDGLIIVYVYCFV